MQLFKIIIIIYKLNYKVLDLSYVIEGQSEDELPEQVMGGIRVSRVDMDSAPFLPEVM